MENFTSEHKGKVAVVRSNVEKLDDSFSIETYVSKQVAKTPTSDLHSTTDTNINTTKPKADKYTQLELPIENTSVNPTSSKSVKTTDTKPIKQTPKPSIDGNNQKFIQLELPI